jgi:hypothetical protein
MVGILYPTSLPGLTRQSIFFDLSFRDAPPWAQTRNPDHALFWIPGSLTQRKIGFVNFALSERPGMTLYVDGCAGQARA